MPGPVSERCGGVRRWNRLVTALSSLAGVSPSASSALSRIQFPSPPFLPLILQVAPGVCTAGEIGAERAALMALRGDFADPVQNPERTRRAAERG